MIIKEEDETLMVLVNRRLGVVLGRPNPRPVAL